jgi:hypothetical protein
MPEYRVLAIDHNNHVHGVPITFTCADDQDAIEKSEQMSDRLDLELWHGTQKITRISARSYLHIPRRLLPRITRE